MQTALEMQPIQIELNTDYSNAQRFPLWMALSVFSTVALVAISTESEGERSKSEKWALTFICLSMIVSFAGTAAYLCARSLFINEITEKIATGVITGLWAAALPMIMNPNHEIAIEPNLPGPVIKNANLYFFSWVCFVCTLALVASMVRDSIGFDISQTPAKSLRWYGLCASSLIVMGSGIRSYKTSGCKDSELEGVEACKRVKLAFSVGIISFIVSALFTAATTLGMAPLLVETIGTTLLLILWSFSTGFTTFGSAPGSTISNLFFGTWISFILVVILFGQCFREYISPTASQSTTEQTGESTEGNGPDESGASSEVPNFQPTGPPPNVGSIIDEEL